jgi:hypothetical protein
LPRPNDPQRLGDRPARKARPIRDDKQIHAPPASSTK